MYCLQQPTSHLSQKYFLKKLVRYTGCFYERNLPLAKRLDKIRGNLDDHGLTYLEKNCLKISTLLEQVCKARLPVQPSNGNIYPIPLLERNTATSLQS